MTRKQELSKPLTSICSRLKKILIAGAVVTAAAVTLGGGLRIPAVQAATGDVSINATNFPDKEFREKVKESYDTNKDGKLSRKEVKNVTILSVESDKITNLKGIEYFTEIQTLWIRLKSLKHMDISKNTKIQMIWCASTKLDKLDISKNKNLKVLMCGGNKFTNLDVSKNTELRYLECRGQNLRSLDVSKNKKLVVLICEENSLTNLDISHNSRLASLNCDDNKLTNLDVSKNPRLTGLSCSDNKLRTLDVSHNPWLTGLSCGGNNIKSLNVRNNLLLQSLKCTSNRLTTLDLSQNIYLNYLYCSKNNIKTVTIPNLLNLTWIGEEDLGAKVKYVTGRKAKVGDYYSEDGTDSSRGATFIYKIKSIKGKNMSIEVVDMTYGSEYTPDMYIYSDYKVSIPARYAKNSTEYTTFATGDNVTKIGAEAFANCKTLKNATLGKDVKTLGARVFSGCAKFESLWIETTKLTAKTVDKQAFAGITSKTTIFVPKSKLAAYKKLFRKCGLSKSVKIEAT